MASLGRYEILQEIGRGGEGIVYLAVDPTIDRRVAIKTLPIAEDPTGALRAKLQQEAKSTARLNHPNIVTVYEFAQQDQLAYIVMEYVPGQSLAAAFESGETFDYQTVYKYLMQAAEALDHAHSEGVVHRDVKPENLMIQTRGSLKIADFGIAKVLDDVTGSKTKTGVVRGTPYYLSPEQIDLKGISGKSDQFALGVVTYQWLTGHRPFEGESWTELLTKILTKDPPPVSQYRESLGEEVTVVLLKALAKDQANRYPTCRDFIADLGFALGVASGETRPIFVTQKLRSVTTGTDAPPPAITAIGPSPANAAITTNQPIPGQTAAGSRRSRGAIFGIAGSAALALAAVLYRFNAAPAPAPAPPSTENPAKTAVVEKQQPSPKEKEQPEPKQTKAESTKPAKQESGPDRKKLPSTREAAKAEPPRTTTAIIPTPQQQQQSETPKVKEPDPAPPVASPEPAAAPAGKYFGPPEGRFTWAGSLAGGQNLIINASSASPGALQGRGLPPSLEVSVTVDPPAIQVLGQPSATNGYRLTLKNSSSSEIQSIVIRWRERKK